MPAVSTRRGRLGAPRPGKAVHRPAARLGRARPGWMALSIGAAVGVLGGMIRLGGAEFRLPLLIGVFGFVALQAVILNKAISLLAVVTAIPARLPAVSYAEVSSQWHVIVTLLCGSLAGAWLGATWATRMRRRSPRSSLCYLSPSPAAIAGTHTGSLQYLSPSTPVQTTVGPAAGVVIGAVAALMGVAGGELLIPTIVLLYAVDIKIAGSLSLAVSLPTMIVAVTRYSRDKSFVVLRAYRGFLLSMAAGSVIGTVAGGLLVGVVPAGILIPTLVLLLLASAFQVWTTS